MSTQTAPHCYPAGTTANIRRVNVVKATAPPHKFFVGEKDKSAIISSVEELGHRDLLFLRNCSNCTYTINVPFVKLLVEGCKNVTINVNEKIRTNIIEIWKSDDVTLKIQHPVYTVQADICNNLKLGFASMTGYQQVVWSNSEAIEISFADAPQHDKTTGLVQMKKIHDDISDTVDQFYVRFVGGVLKEEIMIRLPGGFPSTERECAEWEAEHEQTLPLPVL